VQAKDFSGQVDSYRTGAREQSGKKSFLHRRKTVVEKVQISLLEVIEAQMEGEIE